MKKMIGLIVLTMLTLNLSAIPQLKLAARYNYSPDGELQNVITPVSDTAAIKATYKRAYIGGGKVKVSVYENTLKNPSFSSLDYNEQFATYSVASKGITPANGKSDGRLVSQYVSKARRRLYSIDALGNKSIYSYNRKGQLIKTASSTGAVNILKYNKFGRLDATEDVLGRITKRVYNEDGKATGILNPMEKETIAVFDKYGRQIARKGAGVYPLSFKYNPFGEMLSYTDDNGNTTSFNYDKSGKLIARIYPNGSTIQYKYNRKGLLSVTIEADRKSIYKYDDLNRLVSINVGQGSSLSSTKLVYSKTGQILKITNTDSTTSKPKLVVYQYDDFNRVTLEKTPIGSIIYKYNAKALLAEKVCAVQGQKFVTAYSYDNLNRVSIITSKAGKYKYSYNKQGQIASIVMGNAVVKHAYDQVGRLLSKTLNVGVASQPRTLVTYTYDKLNRRVASKVFDTVWKYKYDDKNQLIGAVAKSAEGKQIFKYGFDKIGNRLTASTGKNEVLLAYNDLNQITTASPAKMGMASMLAGDYQYDVYGNLISTPKASYRYNLNNRLVEVRQKDCTLRYSYDPLGQRIKTEKFDTNGKLQKTTLFVMSGMVEQARVDLDSQGKTSDARFHTLGLDIAGSLNRTGGVSAVLATTDNKSKSRNYLYDGNGNALALMSNSGEITAKYTYSPFGEKISKTGEDTKFADFAFSTKAIDESGLYYYGYRFYNAKLGRWLSRDPIDNPPLSLLAINKNKRRFETLYGFVLNNPGNMWDRLGLECEDEAQHVLNMNIAVDIAALLAVAACSAPPFLGCVAALSGLSVAAVTLNNALAAYQLCMGVDPVDTPPNTEINCSPHNALQLTRQNITCYCNGLTKPGTQDTMYKCKQTTIYGYEVGPFIFFPDEARTVWRWRIETVLARKCPPYYN
jgi:RHS repeat-associated protein